MDRIPDLIVTRHPGAVAWLADQLIPHEHRAVRTETGLEWWPVGLEPADPEYYCYRAVAVRAEVTADDVRGKHVVGNLPLHLAALCASVTVIEFAGALATA